MYNKLCVYTPGERLLRFLRRLGGDDRRVWPCAMISALAAAVLAYHYLVIFGNGNPDALNEGLLVYTGYDWELSCGRWATRYLSRWLSGDVVLPGLWIPLYAMCCGISAVLICRLWSVSHLPSICLISVLLTVNPTVIEQSLLQYMFMVWGVSNVLCVMFAFANLSDKSWLRSVLLYPLFIAVAFGLYQSCIGLLCLVLCMTLIIRLLQRKPIKELLLPLARFAVSALIGLILYFVILRLEILRWGAAESGRLADFSVAGIFTSLPSTLPNAYKTFFAYFFDVVFYRSLLYKLLFVIAGLFIAARCVKLAKKSVSTAVLALVLTLLIPACANIADIVFPYNKPVLIMQYQSILVIPFAVAVISSAEHDMPNSAVLSRAAACLLSAALAWGYVVSANITYKVYERAYDYTYAAVASALDMVYDLPDYSPGEPIAFAGFPDDLYLRHSRAYALSYGKYDNLVFWEGFPGLQVGRRNYLVHFFGVNGGELPYDKFVAAIETEEFEEMNVFPMSNSVRRIDGLIIVKFAEDFPLYT